MLRTVRLGKGTSAPAPRRVVPTPQTSRWLSSYPVLLTPLLLCHVHYSTLPQRPSRPSHTGHQVPSTPADRWREITHMCKPRWQSGTVSLFSIVRGVYIRPGGTGVGVGLTHPFRAFHTHERSVEMKARAPPQPAVVAAARARPTHGCWLFSLAQARKEPRCPSSPSQRGRPWKRS